MKKIRTNRKHRQKRIVVFLMVGLVCLFSAGYASFSQNFLVSGKGTIIEKPITTYELREKKCNTVKNDGLYVDTYEEKRCVYKGLNPDNYISFNNELWRIMNIEPDGTLKIVKSESAATMAWDAVGNRNPTTNTYCSNGSSYGCNAWAATNNLVNSPSSFNLHYPNGNPSIDTGSVSGTVIEDASLNIYLNREYLDAIKEESKYIVNHNFNIGTPGNNNDTEDITTDINQEALYKWNGKVGLMNVTDILKTTSNNACTSLKIGYNNASKSVCSENNWLWPKTGYSWTISPYASSTRSGVWLVASSGCITCDGSNYSSGDVYPVLYLKKDIKLSGKGSETNPYKIIDSE